MQVIVMNVKTQNLKFTLLELLIVIAIITILASILLPAISKARDNAKSIICMSNIKQCYLNFQSYADKFGDKICFDYRKEGCWAPALWYSGDVQDYPNELVCPARWPYKWPRNISSSHWVKGSYYTYGMVTITDFVNYSDLGTGIWVAGVHQNTARIYEMRKVSSPSSFIFLADTLNSSSDATEYGGGAGTAYSAYTTSDTSNARVYLRAHANGNVLFWDGHVAGFSDGTNFTKVILDCWKKFNGGTVKSEVVTYYK